MGATQGACSQVQMCSDVAAPIRAHAPGQLGKKRNPAPVQPVAMQEKTYMTSDADEDSALPISVRSAPPTAREPFDPISTDRAPRQPPAAALPHIQEAEPHSLL